MGKEKRQKTSNIILDTLNGEIDVDPMDAWICMEHLELFGRKREVHCKNIFNTHKCSVATKLKFITGLEYLDSKRIFPSMLPNSALCSSCYKTFRGKLDCAERSVDPDFDPSTYCSSI